MLDQKNSNTDFVFSEEDYELVRELEQNIPEEIQEAARMRGGEQELRERLAMRMACLGALKAGALLIPSATLLRPKDIGYRAQHSGAVAIVASGQARALTDAHVVVRRLCGRRRGEAEGPQPGDQTGIQALQQGGAEVPNV